MAAAAAGAVVGVEVKAAVRGLRGRMPSGAGPWSRLPEASSRCGGRWKEGCPTAHQGPGARIRYRQTSTFRGRGARKRRRHTLE